MKDCSIQLAHNPGDLARVAEALAKRAVNIKALTALYVDGQALARIVPDDMEAARSALQAANIRFRESEVNTVLMENKAGELAAVASRLADAGVNVEAVYLTGIMDDLVEVAFVSDNPKKTKKVLAEF
jgi:hypothetical protein